MVMAAAAEVEEVEEKTEFTIMMKFLQIKDCHFKNCS
jgi:hypothetical protein